MTRTRACWIIVAIAMALLTGCVRVPDSGPVMSAEADSSPGQAEEHEFQPQGPEPGQPASEIVSHFLEASLARPMSVAVARAFLTPQAAASWRPELGFLTYESVSVPSSGLQRTITLTDVNHFDARGRWLRTDPRQSVDIEVEPSESEWRISQLPDELIVSNRWFRQAMSPVRLYFFNSAEDTLVPEPVFVAKGDQMATLLVRGLLSGPIDNRLEHSAIPQGTTLEFTVTIDDQGRADVPLSGDVANLPPAVLQRMSGQFAWTLSQVSGITSVRLLYDGQPIALTGGQTEFEVNSGQEFSPTGLNAPSDLFGLRDGRAVSVRNGNETPLGGPLGAKDLGLRDLSVSLDGLSAAGVTRDGTSVLVASTVDAAPDEPPPVASTVVSQGANLTRPAWDLAGRLWVVDRRPSGAIVTTLYKGRLGTVRVPGVTGSRVVDSIVSRDGTRLITVVRRPTGDQILVNRIAAGRAGGVSALGPSVIVGGNESLQIRDVAWRTPTSIYYLYAVTADQSEARSVSLDGSPASFDPSLLGRFVDDSTRVISTPVNGYLAYTERADGTYEPLNTSGSYPPSGLTALDYAG